MLITYKYDFELDNSEIDTNGNVTAGKMLRLFQKAACDHAVQNGLGFYDLIKNDLIWVVTKVRYALSGKFESGKKYTITTYPRKKTSLLYFRDYYINDADGNEIVRCNSQWCILNFVTRKIQRTDFDFEGEFYEKDAFDDNFARIRLAASEIIGKYEIAEKDLDDNAHTNNANYADMVLPYLKNIDFKAFEIVFQKETRLGDIIYFSKENLADEAEGLIIGGRLESGETVFTVKVSY